MASIGKKITTAGTRYYIQLSPGENAQRLKISFGKITKRQAELAKLHIETLISCRKSSDTIPPSTQKWLSDMPDTLRGRIEALGLVERSVKSRWTVPDWVADYIEKRPDVKEATRRKWRDVESKLAVFFKNDSLSDVTVQQAKAFRMHLQTVHELSENTLRRHIGITRQFFNSAIEAEIITKNPFRGQSVSVRANESRFFYVTQEIAQRVLDACCNAEWRLIFGLARWGGLRCPSEIVKLKWTDIDFEKQRFTVHASKTEHHADSGIRTVPMFPELKPLFQDVFDHAPDGAVYCLDRYKGQWSNFGVNMAKIVKRAGIKPWPKLFQNCRSTRETELFKMTNGNIKAVCSWIGNSPAVAMAHYAQVTDADMKEAAKEIVLNDAEKAVHNPYHEGTKTVQNTSENACNSLHDNKEDCDINPNNFNDLQDNAGSCINKIENVDWAIRDLNPGPAD